MTRHLLRAIPANPGQKFGEVLVKVFDRPIFAALSSRYFDRINIRVTDGAGKEISFLAGSLIATLEIRKKPDDGFLF